MNTRASIGVLRRITSRVIASIRPVCEAGRVKPFAGIQAGDFAAVLLVLLGSALAVAGVLAIPRGQARPGSALESALVYLHVFRRVVVGLCVVCAGIGIAEHVSWLVAASSCIGVGEFLESSYYIGVIEWGRTRPSRAGVC
jgi:hypothetical protein